MLHYKARKTRFTEEISSKRNKNSEKTSRCTKKTKKTKLAQPLLFSHLELYKENFFMVVLFFLELEI